MLAGCAFAIFSRDNVRLFNVINELYQKHAYDLELFIYCSLDIVDEKSSKANEMFLGQLYSDQMYKSFGFITNTGVRMVLVLEVNNLELKDLDIRSIFKHFHTLYCNAISNPFYCLGDEISSKTVVEAGLRILNDNFEI